MPILLDDAASARRRLRRPAPTSPTPTCAGSSRAATSRSSGRRARGRGRRHGQRHARSGSSRRSRSATSSSSGPATREPLGATYLDEPGKEQLVWMGSYGFGPARAAAAAVEQYADEHGISWPRAIAPFDVELVALGKRGKRGAGARRTALRASSTEAGLRDALRRARRRAGGEVRRRRAARLPAAGDGRAPDAAAGEIEVQVRRGRGVARRAARRRGGGGRRAVARAWREAPACGPVSPRSPSAGCSGSTARARRRRRRCPTSR